MQISKIHWPLFLLIFCFISLWNLGINDIWMKNEALYAESVREMIELDSYIVPYYNYEPRLHKPPITYWSIIASVKLFGLNEFAIRFPMFLFGLLSLLFTYKLARIYFDKKVAFFSVLAVAFTPMFIGNIRYSSPEMPLLFFFTATLYFFLKGYILKDTKHFILFYIFLGLTVLTKGYPYYIIIGFIVFIFLCFDTKCSLKTLGQKIKSLHLPLGIVISIVIGGWWYLYTFLDQGIYFLKVIEKETVHRATDYKNILEQLKPFYYIKVLFWAFLPFVWISFLAIAYAVKHKQKNFLFFFSWIFGMYIIFTLSAGKIPNYFLQAFPPLAIFSAYLLCSESQLKNLWKVLYILALILPSIYIGIYLLYGVVNLGTGIYILIISLLIAGFLIFKKETVYIPFVFVISFYMYLVVSVAPIIEKYRPYKEIGTIIKTAVPDESIPIFVEDKSLNNLIFYTGKKLYGKMNIDEIKKYKIPYIAVIYEKNLKEIEKSKILWCGYIYKKRGDSRILTLLKYVIKAEKGDMSGFDRMCVVYKKGEKDGGNYNP